MPVSVILVELSLTKAELIYCARVLKAESCRSTPSKRQGVPVVERGQPAGVSIEWTFQKTEISSLVHSIDLSAPCPDLSANQLRPQSFARASMIGREYIGSLRLRTYVIR